MSTATATKPTKQNTLPGIVKSSPLGKQIDKWFHANDEENDAAAQKLEISGKIESLLKEEKRESATVPHPDSGKLKKFFIMKGMDKLAVHSVADKVGRNTK